VETFRWDKFFATPAKPHPAKTFGGTHWADPFMCSVQVKFRFHY